MQQPSSTKREESTSRGIEIKIRKRSFLIKGSWDKRRKYNLENIKKIEHRSCNKKLLAFFAEEKLDNYKY